MDEDFAALKGRSIERQDTADLHRWRAYHSFFNLDAETDRPLAFHWLMFTELSRETRPDGHPVQMHPFPVLPFPRRMWAGGEINWVRPVTAGAELKRTTTISRAEAKAGGSGQFLLTSLDHVIEDKDGALVKERQDIVFLPPDSRPGGGGARPAPFEPEWSQPFSFGPVELFRYSALTFNSHRIHYDEPYAKAVEGYAALVVHGPLLATRLMQGAAQERAQDTPARLSYRSVAPVLVGEACRLVGRRGESGEDLAILGPDGGLRVTAAMGFAQ